MVEGGVVRLVVVVAVNGSHLPESRAIRLDLPVMHIQQQKRQQR